MRLRSATRLWTPYRAETPARCGPGVVSLCGENRDENDAQRQREGREKEAQRPSDGCEDTPRT